MKKEKVINCLEKMILQESKKEDCNTKYENISALMDAAETVKNSIELRNIDLTGLTLLDEMRKADEEKAEFYEALVEYGYERTPENRNHLIEEACDNIQVILSELKCIGIDEFEISEYWSNEHLEKIKSRPRVK